MPIRIEIDSNIPEFIERLKAAALEGQKAGAEVLAEEFANKINSQPGEWPPLASRTVQEKGHDTMLIRDGYLVSGFKVGSELDPVQMTGEILHVGVEEDNPASVYALAQEFGVGNIPRRSYIRSTVEDQEVRDRVVNTVASTMIAELSSDESQEE